MSGPVRAIMVFAADPEPAARWWAEHLAGAATVRSPSGDFWLYEVDGVEVGFHPEDADRNPQGASIVVYWRVGDLATRRAELIEAGCAPHRGPLQISPDRWICQLRDPFGNVFGLDGP